MVKNAIKVFARLKPEIDKMSTMNYEIHRRPKKHLDEDFLIISAPQKFADYIDNRSESWSFSFRQIFDDTAGQEDIFNDVARPVITSLFDGYNGTIFAYGQTGSGKTYTITGNSKKTNKDSGILPRTIRNIFEIIESNSDNLYMVELSYLEVYNENGYDLLDQKQREVASRLEDLPRVEIHEDELGVIHLKNLGLHTVKNEKEAMDLLIIGDTRRMTSVTPMNTNSSRSHCIFTIILSSKKFGCNRFNRAKMHLVDLAGSERVYKFAISRTILTEAKYINLSLHYLEQVIVSLGQDNASHVPYRNSLLTAILRDSLGGNCITNMLANLSISTFNLEETISTCRFAQRVALIRNDVKLILRKEVKTQIDLLKMENEELRKQIDEINGQLKCQRSAEMNIKYYKDLVMQQDNDISFLIKMLNEEKARICRTTENKMVETDKPKLSRVNQKSLVNIPPDYQNGNIKCYSTNNFLENNYYPLRTLYHNRNFDLISLDESQYDRTKVKKELLNNKFTFNFCSKKVKKEKCTNTGDTCINKSTSLRTFIGNNTSVSSDRKKSNSGSAKMNFPTPTILRQLFGMEKKSPRSLPLADTPNKKCTTVNCYDSHRKKINRTMQTLCP